MCAGTAGGGNSQLAGFSTSSAADQVWSASPLGIDQANSEALRRILAGDPVLIDVVPASVAIPI